MGLYLALMFVNLDLTWAPTSSNCAVNASNVDVLVLNKLTLGSGREK